MCEGLGLRVFSYLLRAHEEKMLDSVSHSWHVVGIAKAADIDIDRCTGLVCFRVMHEKSLELVG